MLTNSRRHGFYREPPPGHGDGDTGTCVIVSLVCNFPTHSIMSILYWPHYDGGELMQQLALWVGKTFDTI